MSGISATRLHSSNRLRRDRGRGRALRVVGLVIAMGATLAACSGRGKNPLKVVVQRCPAPAVVEGVSTLTRFAGDDRTSDARLFTAAIEDLDLRCDQGERVTSRLRFRIVATRGAALRGSRTIEVPYFVAVMRDNAEIVTKRIYRARLVFRDGAERAETIEEIRQTIPSIDQARRYHYELLVGFQLKSDELIYNVVR